MRYLASLVCLLALSLASVASPVRAQEPTLPLTLRASSFYDVDVDPSFPTTAMTLGSVPEHLQLRVPGHPHERQTNPRLPQETEVQQMADASDGLEWDMWSPEPGTSQQPKFEVEHATPSTEQRKRKRGIAIGVVVPVVVISVVVGAVVGVTNNIMAGASKTGETQERQ